METIYSDGRRYVDGVLVSSDHKEVGSSDIQAYLEDQFQKKIIADEDVQRIRPSISDLLGSAAEAIVKITDDHNLVDHPVKEQRLTFCNNCNHLTEQGYCFHIKKKDGTIEKGCGCYMPLKVNFKVMACPVGKW